MDKILFINACVREGSRTLALAKKVMEQFEGEVTELNLEKEAISPLNGELLAKRDELIQNGAFDSPVFCYAREFAAADKIVIAAPFWDLGFPSFLKIYLEAIMVSGITFCYSNGIPTGLCKAKSLKYITTSGGEIFDDFGYTYVKSLAKNFFGISDVSCTRAEKLDIFEISADELLGKADIVEVK